MITFSALDDGDNIFISQLVREANSLWLMLDGLSINNGHTEIVHDGLVNGVTLVLLALCS